MITEIQLPKAEPMVSDMAENLIGSEIIKLAGEVKDKIKKGQKIYNLTIGDFDPKIFPIPAIFLKEIINAYKEGHTNYPAANGISDLRNSISAFHEKKQGLVYSPDEILVAGGARPLIYAIYKTLVDKGDKVLFPVPSWNNNHYCHLSGAQQIFIETKAEENFMPGANDMKDYVNDATLIALCSPLNPTGTVFSADKLKAICELVLDENSKRGKGKKPLYLMYDQIYWVLTYGDITHIDPVSLYPEMRDYTIYVDGISKAFAATGVRVGWSFGPPKIIRKMRAILSHIGAWAPKAEQVATARFLQKPEEVEDYLHHFKKEVHSLLKGFYTGFTSLKNEGLNVDAIVPQAAIYLTVKIDILGKRKSNGEVISSNKEAASYLIDKANVAIVPFPAFGASDQSSWYRLSVGTCRQDDIPAVIDNLRKALQELS